VILKIIEVVPDSDSVPHAFNFNSPTNPRGEANALKDALSSLIQAYKTSLVNTPATNSTSTPSGPNDAQKSASKSTSGAERWFDDSQLVTDFQLQQSLMQKDVALSRTYKEARRTKPESMSDAQFNTQFWSSRIGMLRAHGIETHQQRGSYNVLSVVKPRQVDGELKLNMSAEQQRLIMKQHPLLQRVYDENVPKLNSNEFWSRFFLSRLFKKLKGERITSDDATDPTFDKYLDGNNDIQLEQRLLTAQVPHIIDLEGNEENQGGIRSGNKKDITMRPSSYAKVPIVRTLNSLSSKILSNVAASDVDPANPIGMDEETFNALALRDLQGEAGDNRIRLNIREQSQYLSSDQPQQSIEADLYAAQDPVEVLRDIRHDLEPSLMETDSAGGLDLQVATGIIEDSDSEDEERVPHVGSKASFRDAQQQILESVAVRRAELDGTDGAQSLSGLSQNIFDQLVLVQATTIDFVHHFWKLFLSGDPDRADELGRQAESLNRARDRINAIAEDAEKEREEVIKQEKQHVRDVYNRSKVKLQWSAESVSGGSNVIQQMMASTIRSLNKAQEEYEKALAAERMEAL
jgi:transcription initiation factor TFIIH subunit 1